MLPIAFRTFPRVLRAAPTAARAMPLAPVRVAVPALARGFAAGGSLGGDEIRTRIEEVLRSFEKVDPAKVAPSASFTGDLGLDSLDAVEVVMAIEEEFNIEIPDADADAITSVQDAIDYISRTPDGASLLTQLRRHIVYIYGESVARERSVTASASSSSSASAAPSPAACSRVSTSASSDAPM